MQLRPYQDQAHEAIDDAFKTRNRQYIEMPTGSGKTVTFLSYIAGRTKQTLIVVPSKELLDQAYGAARMLYGASNVSRKGNSYDEPIAAIHICIIASIRGKYLDFLAAHPFDFVIIDECH